VPQREVALYTASKLNEPLANFRPDIDLQPYFKEAWCKKLPPTLLFPGYTPQPPLPAGSLLRRRKDLAAGTPSALRQRLLNAADRLGRRTQYSLPRLPTQHPPGTALYCTVLYSDCTVLCLVCPWVQHRMATLQATTVPLMRYL